jgi:hypothetical protein
MAIMTSVEEATVADPFDAEPCGTFVEDCDREATWMIWVSHHRQGCGSYGWRCDVHYNMLRLELTRLLAALMRGKWANCEWCGQLLTSHDPSDYLRGIRRR